MILSIFAIFFLVQVYIFQKKKQKTHFFLQNTVFSKNVGNHERHLGQVTPRKAQKAHPPPGAFAEGNPTHGTLGTHGIHRSKNMV